MKRSCGFEVGSKNAEQLKIIMVTPESPPHTNTHTQAETETHRYTDKKKEKDKPLSL